MAAARRSLGGGRGVIFAGDSGVGKTALLRAVVTELQNSPEVEVVWLYPSRAHSCVPMAGFAPYVARAQAASRPPEAPLLAAQSVRVALLGRAESRRLVLAVDDAEHLDEQSAVLILQMAHMGEARVVLGSTRGSGPPAGVRSLWKDEVVERIEVAPLDRAATADMLCDLLAEEMLDDRDPDIGLVGTASLVGGEVTAAVWRLSQGRPLYIRELVLEARRSGAIERRDGLWRLHGELRPGPRLAEIVLHRLLPLSGTEREALDIVVVGDPVPLSVLLTQVSGAAFEAPLRAGLIRCDGPVGDEAVRPADPVVADLARRALPPTRAALIGGRLADAFTRAGRLESDLVRVAAWRLDSGAEPAPDLLVRASLRAGAAQDWRLAGRLADAACHRGRGADATLARVEALRSLGRHEEAMAALATMDRDTSTLPREAALAAGLRATILCFGLGRAEEASAGLADALTDTANPDDRAWLEAIDAGLQTFAGNPIGAVARVENILRRPEVRGSRAERTARSVLAIALARTGLPVRALQVLDGGPNGESELPESVWTLTARSCAYLLAGEVGPLERLAGRQYEQAVERGDELEWGQAACTLGHAALARARLGQAVAYFREANAALRTGASLTTRLEAAHGLAEALAISGDLDGARDLLEETRPEAEMLGPLMPGWQIAAACVSAGHGAMGEAFDRLDQAAGLARANGQTASEVQAWLTAVRFGSSEPAAGLADLATWVEGPLIAIAADHASALAGGGSGPALDVAAERYADLGLNLYAAEAAAQACRAHRSAGHDRRASASAGRGHFLLGSGGEGRPPLGLVLALTPPELTRREREVAMMAATGLPSPAIAKRLCLSVRTVETHLARVYLKLGISGRLELAGALVAAPDQVQAG
jgi:DNA-binding CsgD family transcriptional regulator